jgi:hypothetical protein
MIYEHCPEQNCVIIRYRLSNDNTKEYYLDTADFFKVLNKSKSFIFHNDNDDYPSYLYNYRYVNYLEFLFKNGNVNEYVFLNGNKCDLRASNIGINHRMHQYVVDNYTVIKSIPGHYPKYKHNTIMKNPLWKISVDGKERYLMFCEPDAFCILCEESYNKVLEYEKQNNVKLTFHKMTNGYLATKHNNNEISLYIHQIIMNWHGHGKGTGGISVDHIDRNPLNNTMDNLRLATYEEQQQNTKGTMPNTKRERQAGARDLPEGIEQSMLRKYVVYYLNVYNKEKNKSREYFRVEDPRLKSPWESSKSQSVSIMEKLQQANKVAEELEQGIYVEKEKERDVPKGFYVSEKNGKTVLTYDKRDPTTGKCCSMKATLKEDAVLNDEVEKMKVKLNEKYGIVFDES